jgi:hypothetical protein
MSKSNGSPGSVFGSCTQSAVENLFKAGMIVVSVKVKYPGIDPLMIVQVKTTEGPKITFVGGPNLDAVGRAFKGMVDTDSVKWKEDEWEMRRLAGDLD